MLAQFKRRLEKIVSLEENGHWNQVNELCLRTVKELNDEGSANLVHDLAYRFLDDCDIRERDIAYAEEQRRRLKQLLSERS